MKHRQRASATKLSADYAFVPSFALLTIDALPDDALQQLMAACSDIAPVACPSALFAALCVRAGVLYRVRYGKSSTFKSMTKLGEPSCSQLRKCLQCFGAEGEAKKSGF